MRAWPALLVLALCFCSLAGGQTGSGWKLRSVPPPLPGQSAQPPLPPVGSSPVRFLGSLLDSGPEERIRMLENHTDRSRAYWQGKIAQYEEYPREERDRRLRISSLHWNLALLIRVPLRDRLLRLSQIPERERRQLERQLERWDALEEPLRKDILENIKVLQYFAQLQGGEAMERANPLEGAEDPEHPLHQQARTWRQLPDQRRREMYHAYLDFYRLPRDQQQSTLSRVPFPPVREELRQQVELLSSLPPEERESCLQALRQFAAMSHEDQVRFLENAQKWRSMKEEERSFWVHYVKQLPPLPPPLASQEGARSRSADGENR